jgi:hypothetical protein
MSSYLGMVIYPLYIGDSHFFTRSVLIPNGDEDTSASTGLRARLFLDPVLAIVCHAERGQNHVGVTFGLSSG